MAYKLRRARGNTYFGKQKTNYDDARFNRYTYEG